MSAPRTQLKMDTTDTSTVRIRTFISDDEIELYNEIFSHSTSRIERKKESFVIAEISLADFQKLQNKGTMVEQIAKIPLKTNLFSDIPSIGGPYELLIPDLSDDHHEMMSKLGFKILQRTGSTNIDGIPCDTYLVHLTKDQIAEAYHLPFVHSLRSHDRNYNLRNRLMPEIPAQQRTETSTQIPTNCGHYELLLGPTEEKAHMHMKRLGFHIIRDLGTTNLNGTTCNKFVVFLKDNQVAATRNIPSVQGLEPYKGVYNRQNILKMLARSNPIRVDAELATPPMTEQAVATLKQKWGALPTYAELRNHGVGIFKGSTSNIDAIDDLANTEGVLSVDYVAPYELHSRKIG